MKAAFLLLSFFLTTHLFAGDYLQIDTLPCDSNIDCESAIPFGEIDPGENICLIGCTNGMPILTVCGSTGPTAFYSFNSGSNNSGTISAIADSSDLAVTLINDCNTIVECNAEFVNLTPNTNYQVLVSNLDNGNDHFEICISLFQTASECIKEESLVVRSTSLGSPVEGPFIPGEILTMVYTTNYFSGGGCQWIHSFIPYLSDCWGNTIPEILSPYPSETNPSNLAWYPAGTIEWKPTSNDPPSLIGISGDGKLCPIGTPGCSNFTGGGQCGNMGGGTPMPAGWIVTNPSGSCNGSSEPNVSWGIVQGCNTASLKELTFNIQIPNDVCNCLDGEELVIGMASFTDGATGGWNNPLCNGNGLLKKKLLIQCCEAPLFEVSDDEICNRDTFVSSITITPDNSTIQWTVFNDPEVLGASDGQGSQISQVLTNTGSVPHQVVYSVFAIDSTGCRGAAKSLVVTVLPEIKSNIESVINTCSLFPTEITALPTGGTEEGYEVNWSTGHQGVSSIIFSSDVDTFITVSIKDFKGCEATDTIYINVNETSEIIRPSDTSLIGKLVFINNVIQNFSVNDFANATDYLWTLDGETIGVGQTISYDFNDFDEGFYTLCVNAQNCLPDEENICWEIHVVTLSSKNAPVQSFRLFPNPNTGYFDLELPAIVKGSIEIYDINGINIYHRNLDNSLIQKIELNKLQPALYNVLVRNITGKVIGINKLIIH